MDTGESGRSSGAKGWESLWRMDKLDAAKDKALIRRNKKYFSIARLGFEPRSPGVFSDLFRGLDPKPGILGPYLTSCLAARLPGFPCL